MRSLLDNPKIYRKYQSLVWSGRKDFWGLLVHVVDHLNGRMGRKINVLDVGCGDGKLALLVGEHCNYTGVDLSEKYVAHANRSYAAYGEFRVADLGRRDSYELFQAVKPDLITMVGVIHHCADEVILQVMNEFVRKFPSAAFLSVDGVFVPNQNPIANLLLRLDRGEHIRTIAGYKKLLPDYDYILDNYLRVPFDMIVFYHNLDLKRLAERYFADRK